MNVIAFIVSLLLAMTTVSNALTPCQEAAAAAYGSSNDNTQQQWLSAYTRTFLTGNSADVNGIFSLSSTLMKYFNGQLAITNRDGVPTTVNFLDGIGSGSPVPGSNTEKLVKSFVRFFSSLYGCQATGTPPYDGVSSMYEVHKFMKLSKDDVDYFIKQVVGAAAANSVSPSVVESTNTTMYNLFMKRCAPVVTAEEYPNIPSFLHGHFQTVCTDASCTVGGDDCTYNGTAPSDSIGGSGGESGASNSLLSLFNWIVGLVAPMLMFA